MKFVIFGGFILLSGCIMLGFSPVVYALGGASNFIQGFGGILAIIGLVTGSVGLYKSDK